jgi:hypothetical protein
VHGHGVYFEIYIDDRYGEHDPWLFSSTGWLRFQTHVKSDYQLHFGYVQSNGDMYAAGTLNANHLHSRWDAHVVHALTVENSIWTNYVQSGGDIRSYGTFYGGNLSVWDAWVNGTLTVNNFSVNGNIYAGGYVEGAQGLQSMRGLRMVYRGHAGWQGNYVNFMWDLNRTHIIIDGTDVGYIGMNMSDYRVKENIAPLTSGLDAILKLKPCEFEFKTVEGFKFPAGRHTGFIAHEVGEVIPDGCVGEKDAVLEDDGKMNLQGLNDTAILATLVKAVQELAGKVKALEAR